jgi:hypothetical protein
MIEIFKYARHENLEDLRNGYIILNAAWRVYPVRKYNVKNTWMVKMIFAVENIQDTAERELVNRLQ